MLKSLKNSKNLKNCKRILSLILVVSMLLSMVTFTVSAEETSTKATINPDVIYYEKASFGIVPDTKDVISQNWANYGNVYYYFENIGDASLVNNSIFTVYRSAIHDKQPVNIYTGVDSNKLNAFSTSKEKVAYIKTCKAISLTSVRSYDSTNEVVTLTLGDLGLNDGDSFVIYFHNDGDNASIGGNKHASYPPTITYDKDVAAFNEKVLSAVNSAADKAALDTVLNTYKKTIGIADTYALASKAEITSYVADIVLENKPVVEEEGETVHKYADFAAVVAAYEAAYNAQIADILSFINDATDNDVVDLVDWLVEFKVAIGISDLLVSAESYKVDDKIAQYIVTNRPEEGYADLAAVKTAYQAGYETEYPSVVLAQINAAADAATLASLLETNADLIGIDFSRYALATDAINNALLVETDFESLTAVAEAYNNAYYTVYTQKTLYPSRIVVQDKNVSTYAAVSSTSERYETYLRKGYYIFDNIADASLMQELVFSVGYSGYDKTFKFYVSKKPFPDSTGYNETSIAEFTSTTTNEGLQSADATMVKNEDGTIYTAKLPETLTISDGDTLVIYAPNSGGNQFVYLNGASTARKPMLNYYIDLEEQETKILNLINTATVENIETVLSTYSETIGYNLNRYTAVKEDVHTAILNKEADYTSLGEVAEVVNTVYYTKYTRATVNPDKIYYEKSGGFGSISNSDATIAQAWGQKGNVYYYFENVEDASLIKDAVFTVYRSADHSNAINIYTGVDSVALNTLSTEAEKVAYIKTCTSTSLKSVKSYDSTVITLTLSNLGLNDGDSFVIYFHNDGDSASIGGNAHKSYPPTISFDKDVAAFNKKVLGLINEATADTIETVVNTYIETLGIDAEKYAFAKEKINAAIVGQNFETIADVTAAYITAYEAHYDEVYNEKEAYVDVIYGYSNNNANADPKTVSTHTETNSIDRNYGMAGKLWYVFNDIEWVEHSAKMTFSVGNNSSQKNPTTGVYKPLTIYVLNTEVPTNLETKADLDSAVAEDNRLATATISGENIASLTVDGLLTVEIPVELSGAKSIVLFFDDTSGTINGAGSGVSPTRRPTLTFEVDENALAAEILAKLNASTSDEETKSVLTAYEETLKIDSSKLELVADEGIYENFQDWTTLEDIKREFISLIEIQNGIWKEHAVNVTKDARQSFKGFGYTNSSFNLSGSTIKSQILKEALDDLNMRSMKIWVEIGNCVSEDENGNITVDASSYISSLKAEENGYVYASDHGVKEFIFGPTVRVYKLPSSYVTEGGSILEEKAYDYGVLLADIIKQFKDNGIDITMTTIINEGQAGLTNSVSTTDEEGNTVTDRAYIMAQAILGLRATLDKHGLTDVKIAAPEIANVDGGHTAFYNDMKNEHPDAYELIDAWAIHSYNMSLTSSLGNALWNDGKEVISLESCNTGGADYDDESDAATNAARALNDINNGVTLWTHFHLMGGGGDSTSLIHYYGSSNTRSLTNSYDYLKALSNAFTEGTVIRKSTLDEKAIDYTYALRKPLINTASGVDKNGNWVISLVNGSDDEKSYLDNGFATLPDTYVEVTLTVEELADVASKTFTVYSSREENNGTEITLLNGTAKFKLYPRELVVLTEKTSDTAKVIYSVEKDGKTYSRINANGAMTGIFGEYSGSKLNDVSFYNLESGTNVIEKSLTEGTDKASIMVFDSMGTMKPNMDKFSVYSAQ